MTLGLQKVVLQSEELGGFPQAEKQLIYRNIQEMQCTVRQHTQQIPEEERMSLKTEEVHATTMYFINTLKKENVHLEGLSVKAKLTPLSMSKR